MKNKNENGRLPQSLFLPAISLLRSMSYARKFALLWILSMVTIGVVVYSLFVSLDRIIQPSMQQLDGLVLVEPISRSVQAIQLHRGISSALLAGNEKMRERRAAQEQAAAKAFETMETLLPSDIASGETFLRIKADWEQLRRDGLMWPVEKNFAAHTRVIEQLHLFKVSVSDDYRLTLDPDIASYYLIDTALRKLPHALEYLGQIRAYGTGILAKKRITENQKIKLHNLIAGLDSAVYELRVNLYKTGRHNPAIQGELETVSEEVANSAWQVASLAEADILSGRFKTSPEAFLATATTEIDRSYTKMYDAILPTAERLITARIADSRKTLYKNGGLAFLAFMVVIYFAISMCTPAQAKPAR